MRLINSKTLQIQEFNNPKVPRYAILSYTWGDGELTYQDWLYVQNQTPARWGWVQITEETERLKSTEGYHKVVKACEYARQHNSACQWLWVDTVCIDKTSSAELSEAINSMFEWYRRAEVCYAFLVDVPPLNSEELAKCSQRTSPFRQSRWFRRGWTLQELVAPWSVVFLSKDWTTLGNRATLARHIATITSIPESSLSGNWSRIRDQTSVAQKMSWAARRQTTRIEDRAYCLMGLFEINMPLLYGEGEKAFHRLQLEIIKKTEDLSFLAWKSDRSETVARDHFIYWKLPALADSPARFFSARKIAVKRTGEGLTTKRVFTANTGIFIHRPLLATLNPSFKFAPLNSESLTASRPTPDSLWIPLVKSGASQGFTRSSFPVSTVVTALSPSRCGLYTGKPSEACLINLHEPSSARNYFRKRAKEPGNSAAVSSGRQVCILPVFATQSPWVEIAESYPAMEKGSLLFSLTEARGHVYHGTLLLAARVFAVYFLAIFSQESDRPLYWDVVPLLRVARNSTKTGSLIDELASLSKQVTECIWSQLERDMATLVRPDADLAASRLAAARKRGRDNLTGSTSFECDGGRYIFPGLFTSRQKRESRFLARATFVERGAFVEMDNRWHTFPSAAGLEDSPFTTHINLVMIGNDL